MLVDKRTTDIGVVDLCSSSEEEIVVDANDAGLHANSDGNSKPSTSTGIQATVAPYPFNSEMPYFMDVSELPKINADGQNIDHDDD